MMRLNLILLLSILFGQLAWAEVSIELQGDEIYAIQKEANGFVNYRKLGTVAKIKKGTRVFHWGDADDIARWLKNGRVDSSELDYLITQPEGQAAGGGFYVSSDALDTVEYGPKAVAVTLPELKGVRGHYPADFPYKIELARKLRENGFSYIDYHQTWMNIIDAQSLQTISVPVLEDFVKSQALGGLSVLAAIENRKLIDLSHPELQKKNPIFGKIVTGQPIDAAAKAEAWKHVSSRLIYPPWIPPSVAKFFGPEIKEAVLTNARLLKTTTNLMIDEMTIRMGRQLGFDYATVLGPDASNIPKASLSEVQPVVRDYPKVHKLDSFGQRLARAMEFIDYNDLILEMARGASEPWRRYDTDGKRPMLDRWLEVTDKKFKTEAQTIDGKIAVNRILSENPAADIRDTPVVAGGDIMVNGKGYYRITESEKAALEANPLLTTEIIPDPSAEPGQHIYLGRHEYPSAKTYQKFEKYLTPDLLKELQATQVAGKLESTPGLTQRVLRCLLEKTQSLESSLERYLQNISIHPFMDHNERTFRAVHQAQTGIPLFLRDFAHELFFTPKEFVPQAINGEGQLMAIRQKMLDEFKRNPGSPKYYDIPEFWQVAMETDVTPKDPVGFVRDAKALYLDPKKQDLLPQKKLFRFESATGNACVSSRIQSFLKN